MLHKISICTLFVFLAIGYGQVGEVSFTEGRLVPKMLNYQGYLTDTLGSPIDDTLDMLFAIYDSESGLTELWSETQLNIPIEKGVFHVLLGTVNPVPDSVFTGGTECWLELILEGPQTLTPRTRITSVGYSYTSTYAVYADTADYARSQETAPVGTVLLYAGSSPPTGWFLCDGTEYSTGLYPDLYAVIGYNYGGSAGMFAVPDLRGRGPMGYSSGETEFDSLGEWGGEKRHTLTINEMPNHNHNLNDPGHSHGINQTPHSHTISDPGHRHQIRLDDTFTGSSRIDDTGSDQTGTTYSEYAQTNISINATTIGIGIQSASSNISISPTGNGQSHNNLQPYLVFNYIIKY